MGCVNILPKPEVTVDLSSGRATKSKTSEFTINPTTWTLVPPSPMAGRIALTIQNKSGETVQLRLEDNSGTEYIEIEDNEDRNYNDISDSIAFYAKATSSPSLTIKTEELGV